MKPESRQVIPRRHPCQGLETSSQVTFTQCGLIRHARQRPLLLRSKSHLILKTVNTGIDMVSAAQPDAELWLMTAATQIQHHIPCHGEGQLVTSVECKSM